MSRIQLMMFCSVLFVGCVSKADFEKVQLERTAIAHQCDSLSTSNSQLERLLDSLRGEIECIGRQIDSLKKDKEFRLNQKCNVKKKPKIESRKGVEGIGYKPIIYCYPTDTIDISVKIFFADSGKLSYTYPTYGKKGWDVTAFPDGKLIDRKGTSYYSLFWEGEVPVFPDDSTGFVVHRDSLNSFFERSLDSLGLNYKEKQEFIIFWSPLLMVNEYTFIHFSRKNYALSVKMDIVPKPETLNRFLMLYRKASADEKPVPQTLENPGRKGFTVVEWGGAEMKEGIQHIL